MKKNYIGAISAAVIAGTLMLPTGIAGANPCTNSASPWCVNSGLPREMPLSPASEDACAEFYSYTKADNRPGEIVSVPQRLIAPARAAGCDIPPMLAY